MNRIVRWLWRHSAGVKQQMRNNRREMLEAVDRAENLAISRKYLLETIEGMQRRIDDSESEIRKLKNEIEIHKKEAELLAFVVARDRERIAAETAIYFNAAMNGRVGEPVPNVGAKVATTITPQAY